MMSSHDCCGRRREGIIEESERDWREESEGEGRKKEEGIGRPFALLDAEL